MADATRDEFIQWARNSCWRLAGLESHLDAKDMEPLAAVVGKARIVGLGESWHSSGQLLCLKNRIVRFLVERLGFNAVAFEGGLPGTRQMDDYIGGGPGNAAAALRAFGQPMWLNAETVEIVDWLRTQNSSRAASDRIRAFGVDPAYPGAAIHSVLAFLDRVDSAWQAPHRELLHRIERALLSVPLDSGAKSAVWGSTGVYEQLSATEQEQFRSACADLVARLEQNRASYSHRTSRPELEWALRQAVVLLQAYNVASVRSRSLSEANVARDFAFAENLAWFLDQTPGNPKVIVLAHNIHVAREPFRSAPVGPAIPSLGGYLSDWLSDDYVAIGSMVGRGRHSGGADAGLAGVAPTESAAKQASANDSNDAALEEVGLEHFVLPVPRGETWASTPRVTRSHLDPQPEYSLKKSFDAVAYVDRITRSAPLVTRP